MAEHERRRGVRFGERGRGEHAALSRAAGGRARPPLGRHTLLSKLDETLLVDGERWDLSSNYYPGGVVYPEGWRHVQAFTPYPVPTWTFRCVLPGGATGNGKRPEIMLTRRVFLARDKNTVYVTYRLDAPLPGGAREARCR
jgi:hypothetical protein